MLEAENNLVVLISVDFIVPCLLFTGSIINTACKVLKKSDAFLFLFQK
jgi:hypothetical protein